MKLDIDVSGGDRLAETFAELAELSGLEQALREAGEEVRSAAERELLADGDARAASALARSLTVIDEEGEARIAIGTPLELGAVRELGSRRQGARPWLGPALEAVVPAIMRRMRDLIEAATRALARR